MLMSVTVFSVTATQISNTKGSSMPQIHPLGNRAMWDLEFNYPVGTDTGSLYLVGAVFDGTYFYCPTFNSATVYRFDASGNYLDSFTMSGVPNLIDLAWDGTYAYGTSTTGTTLYQMDMAAHTTISSVSLPAATYNVAYDAQADGGNGGFWIGQWSNHMTLVDRAGHVLDSITPVPDSVLGFAWDPYTKITGYDGPFLWVFSGTSSGMDAIIEVIDLHTKTLIPDVSHDVAAELGGGIAGGLELTTDYQTGKATLYGIVQGTTNDYMFGYEIATTNQPPDTPGAPSGPDHGLKGVQYTFTASTSDPEGDPIEYWFEWGDGQNSGWVTPGSAQHAWTSIGTFDVTVKARDSNGGESGVSDVHQIVISEGAPALEIQTLTGGLFKIKTSIKNTGTIAASGVHWSIVLNGGAFIGKNSSGTISSIAPGGDTAISSKFILGFGKTEVTVTATIPESSDTVVQNGTIFLFFIKL